MRGHVIFFLGSVGVVLFSCLLFVSDNLSFFWLFLELGTLSLVPLFFLYSGEVGLEGLFSYLVVSSISSSFIVCGLLYENVLFLLVLGFLVKFGIFPFFSWVYSVVLNSNWAVVWGLSTFLKASFMVFNFLLNPVSSSFLNWLCGVSFVLLGVLFWVYSFSWAHCWCHMMLSSSVALVAMAVSQQSELLLAVFFVYLVWATAVVWLFSVLQPSSVVGLGISFLFVFLVLSFPGTFSIFYKLLMGGSIYACSFMVFLVWAFYSVSEQGYLLKFIIGGGLPQSLAGFKSVV